jgi:hypothetical protein
MSDKLQFVVGFEKLKGALNWSAKERKPRERKLEGAQAARLQ